MLKAFYKKGQIEAGCDEAGRGCLAGPVVAAAVILPIGYSNKFLNDSKKITEKIREELKLEIMQDALAYAIASVSPQEIDEINILNASFLAMHRAIDQLSTKPGCLLIDGNRFNKHSLFPHVCIVKGDSKFMSIAAASILAKTKRDELMREAHDLYPQYRWDKNKGYPTKDHRDAIRRYGTNEFHRLSFNLLGSPQLNLFD